MNHIPSLYQQRLFARAREGRGFVGVRAVAGSGKSYSLLRCVEDAPSHNAIVFAFNKHIADHLRDKVPDGVEVSTIHSFGLQTIRKDAGIDRPKVTEGKYTQIALDYLDQNPALWKELKFTSAWTAMLPLVKLLEFTRLTLTDPTDQPALVAMATTYDLLAPPEYLAALPTLLKKGAKQAETNEVIDFTDMLWLPHRWDLRTETYDGLYIDELQDLSAAQLALVLKAKREDSHGVIVGDPSQSIMGFAGADLDSYRKAIVAFQAEEMPLSICYRCPTTHLDLARELVPEIEAREDAPVGTVRTLGSVATMCMAIAPGDMVLCRNTAPLIEACIALIKAKIPARVRGRDIGSDLAKLVRTISKSGDIREFPNEAGEYFGREWDRLLKTKAPKGQLSTLTDRIDGVMAAYTGIAAQSIEQLVAEIQAIFADDRRGVVLSTVHRAKGLEANSIYILKPELLTTSELQEKCVKYVALTRAKDVLTFVETLAT